MTCGPHEGKRMENSTNITFRMETGEETTVAARKGECALDVAKRGGVPIDAPCGGNGSCGKCRVRLTGGGLSDEEGRGLSQKDHENGWRLACVSSVIGDAELFVPSSALAYKNRIRTADAAGADFERLIREYGSRGFAPDTCVSFFSAKVDLDEPSIDDPTADSERLVDALRRMGRTPSGAIRITMRALRKLPDVLRESGFSVYCTIKVEGDDFIIIDADAAEHGLIGLAVDIGTTSVSAILTDLVTGKALSSGSAGNAQIRFGADVIHRIIESEKPGGLERLRAAIIDECLRPLTEELCAKAGVSADEIIRLSIAGNTTMMHLLAGVNPAYLRLEPYVPAFFGFDGLSGADVGLAANPYCDVVMAPAVGSYVGGDITAGIFASGIHRKQEISLFLDLGTNGELALGNEDFLMVCACSAGPAFEGGEINCGMRATDGAIEKVDIDEDSMEPKVSVIGDRGQRALGLCGSGLVDLVSRLFQCGIIDAGGRFIKEGPRIRKDEWGITRYVVMDGEDTLDGNEIYIDDADIDNFIRAKGSIFSAIRTLTNMTDIGLDMIEGVYIAGGIGSGIDIKNAIGIGMLPSMDISRYHYLGNTSLMGAYAALVYESAEDEIKEIASKMTYIELSTWPEYMDEFIAACFIPHTDIGLFSRRDS